MADVSSLGRVRTQYYVTPAWSLQELCRRALIAQLSLAGWNALMQRYSERFRRRAALIPSGQFSGCGVDFCLEHYFSKSGHPSYLVKCLLDQRWYLAIRVQDRRPDHIIEDEEFWSWARFVNRHLLSALAVAVDSPASSIYIVTVCPDDGLERFAGALAARALCVRESNLWKFLQQLCSALLFLEGEGLSVEPFDFCNVYLRGADIVLNNKLVWTKRSFDATSLPAALWSLLLPPGEDCSAVCALATRSKKAANAFSVAAVLAQLVSLSIGDEDSVPSPDSRPTGLPTNTTRPEVCRKHGVEVVASPCHYSEYLMATLREIFRNPSIPLKEVRDTAKAVWESTA